MDYKILRPRQNPRLQNYDYKTANHYFVTVCTHHKQCVFGAAGEPNGIGQMAAQGITAIPEHFPEVTVDEYVVMPNHVHLLLQAHACEAAGHVGPALQDVVRWYKTMTTNAFIRAVKAGEMPPFDKTAWQASFYDEVIRGQDHYLRAWQYIDDNPAHWAEDEYYSD